jgi:SAM-dependent methyltransferase
MSDITSPEHVRTQYETEDRLETRRSVWHPTDDGRDPADEAFKAIDRAMTGDSRVLEVGCGTGAMAERINALPGVTLVAVDHSERFVELTAARGVDARQADICYLPFEDDTFDVVYAGWMLYHVRDLDRALAEVRRVLRPGGTFVAVTNGDDRTWRHARCSPTTPRRRPTSTPPTRGSCCRSSRARGRVPATSRSSRPADERGLTRWRLRFRGAS